MIKFITFALVCTISLQASAQITNTDSLDSKRIANAFDIIEQNKKLARNYGVFMRIPSMSAGLYTLRRGDKDEQTPHTKDEIYYIQKGKAKLQVGTKTYDVKEGDIIFVEAYKEHRFFDITKDLAVLVVFSAEQPKPDKK